MKILSIKNNLILLGVFATIISFNSCKQQNELTGNTLAPEITAVYLEDAQSKVPDRQVDFARLGQTIRLQGANFIGVTKVLINGYSCYFNLALMADNSMIVAVNQKVPTIDVEPSLKNTIQLVKGIHTVTYHFDIRAAAPAVTVVSHTMPQAGDVISIIGTNLQGVTRVLFPGNIEGTNISSDDVDGKWCRVTVPAGITASGSLTVIGANGGAYSPAYINFKEGVMNDFDGVDNYSWGSGIDNTKLNTVIPASGDCKSQGNYSCFNSGSNTAANGVQKFWLKSDLLMPIMNNIDASTSTDQCAIQMDIYVEGVWNSGIIRFVMADGWGNSRYCMLYQPVYPNGTSYDATAFVNPNCWFTITLPFSLSNDFTGKTLGDVIAQMAQASYKQSGPFFENSGIQNVFDPVVATQKIYFDNIRIVPLATPTYSDFPDE